MEKHYFVPDFETTQARFCKTCGKYLTDESHIRADEDNVPYNPEFYGQEWQIDY